MLNLMLPLSVNPDMKGIILNFAKLDNFNVKYKNIYQIRNFLIY